MQVLAHLRRIHPAYIFPGKVDPSQLAQAVLGSDLLYRIKTVGGTVHPELVPDVVEKRVVRGGYR